MCVQTLQHCEASVTQIAPISIAVPGTVGRFVVFGTVPADKLL